MHGYNIYIYLRNTYKLQDDIYCHLIEQVYLPNTVGVHMPYLEPPNSWYTPTWCRLTNTKHVQQIPRRPIKVTWNSINHTEQQDVTDIQNK